MSWLRATPCPIPFVLVSRIDGQGLSGAAVTIKVSKDGQAQQTPEGTISEMGGGQYVLNASAADMNGDVLGFLMTAANAVPVEVTIKTALDGGSAIYTYGTGVTVGQTLAEQLLSVQAAITAIESGAQEVSLDGGIWTRANVSALYDREERLQNRIVWASRGRNTVAEF